MDQNSQFSFMMCGVQ